MDQCIIETMILANIKTDTTIVDTIKLVRVLVQNEINSALILLLKSEDTELSLLVAASRATRDCCCNSLAALVACDIACRVSPAILDAVVFNSRIWSLVSFAQFARIMEIFSEKRTDVCSAFSNVAFTLVSISEESVSLFWIISVIN